MIRFIRSSLVIARRDFGATVLSKAFIFFLLGPLFPLILGGVFGSIGARVATQTERPVVAVVWSAGDFARLSEARGQMAQALSEGSVVRIVRFAPERDLAAQQQRLLASERPPVRAVLSGSLNHPHLAGAVSDDSPTLGQLRMLIANAHSSQ